MTMNEEPIYKLDKKSLLGSHDGLEIYATEVVIVQRTLGKGSITLPRDQITEVRTDGKWSFAGRGYRLHLRLGSKKYVVRHLKKQEAEEAAAALTDF